MINWLRRNPGKMAALYICAGVAGIGFSGYVYFGVPHTLLSEVIVFVTAAGGGVTGLLGVAVVGNRILPDWLRRVPGNAVAPQMGHAHDLQPQQLAQQQANIQVPMQAQFNPAPQPAELHHEQPQAQEQHAPIIPAPQPAQLHNDEPARPAAPVAKRPPARRMDIGVSR